MDTTALHEAFRADRLARDEVRSLPADRLLARNAAGNTLVQLKQR
jgi:hypothetical protein